jgi:peptide/nickel transport system substrate-binding protein
MAEATMATLAKLIAVGLNAGAAIALATATAGAQARFECARMGGDFVFALEAKVPTADQHVSTAAQSRNGASAMFESLMTRDENMAPMLALAASVDESADGLTYTFKLRPGVKFHNDKTMTSADVVASYERYKRVGVDRSILLSIDRWEAPDDLTFVVRLKAPQSTFLETFSNFAPPVVIIPKESEAAEPNRLPLIGTGPFQLVEFVGDSHVKVKRFDAYQADTRFPGTNGLGGYKKVCVDTATFRMLVEPGTRTAALEVGEVHGVEDVPTTAQKRLKGSTAIRFMPLENFWLHISIPNLSQAPTDNVRFRQAVQAALDMEEIMEASGDGAFRLEHALQFPTSAYYTPVGKEFYNQKNKDKAKRLLQEAGYRGEKVTLLTNRDYVAMYQASLVMAEQMKAVGINAELLVLDWPAAVQMSVRETKGWNYFFTGWTTVVAQGGIPSLRNLADPNNVHKPKDNQSDPVFMQHFREGLTGKTLDDRRASFARAQFRAHEEAMVLTFGVLPKVAAVRANVDGFKPYFVPRLWNVAIR